MALNKFMHPRNPYKENPPDFKELAVEFEEFRAHCVLENNGKVTVNFQDDGAVRSLSRVLLKRDFGLDVTMPKGCLVPRVPQKLNYLLWIEDVLQKNNINSEVLGIDIGTGASCIHALLGARQTRWRFIATDADKMAAETAHNNVRINGLQDYIRVMYVDEHSLLRDVLRQFPSTQFSFSMCNPPFFESDETEKRFTAEPYSGALLNQRGSESSEILRPPPRSATLARKNELEFEGGEVTFVGRMIDDSVLLQSQISVYTSMLGKKSSVPILRKKLSRIEGAKYTVATLCQGRTQRWILAWTYRDDIQLEQPHTSTSLSISDDSIRNAVGSETEPMSWLGQELRALQLSVIPQDDASLSCEARIVTWTNQRIRRRAESRMAEPELKRPKFCYANVSCSVDLGEGDGRDSLTNAGNFDSCEVIEEFHGRVTVAVQTYHPVPQHCRYLVRFRARHVGGMISFEFLEGSKQHLHQLLQYFRNRLKVR